MSGILSTTIGGRLLNLDKKEKRERKRRREAEQRLAGIPGMQRQQVRQQRMNMLAGQMIMPTNWTLIRNI